MSHVRTPSERVRRKYPDRGQRLGATARPGGHLKFPHPWPPGLLTGLPNRRLFLDRLEQEIKHANRSGIPIAVLFMDLDGFKEVNDSLGHEGGDRLLAEVAERLTRCVRQDDTVARLGGDEFAVILAGAKQRTGVERAAQTIIDALSIPFRISQRPVQISVSIGITFYPQDASSPVTLLGAADQAMYRAKNSGANQMCFYDTFGE